MKGLVNASAPVQAAPTPRATPLDVKTAIAPYKGRRRMSLRIENMPQSARLSAGTNNGDGTWSLALDELEDLFYQPPERGDDNPALRIRIISKEDDVASTVALLDFPVTIAQGGAQSIQGAPADKEDTASSLKNRLRAEKRELKLIHVAERDVGSQVQNLSAPGGAEEEIARELASARALWEGELHGKLAAAALEFQRHREAWIAEQAAQAADEKAWADILAAEAVETARRQAQEESARASDEWRIREAARLAGIEADWQAKEQDLQAQAERLAAHARDAEAARNALLDELETVKDRLSKSEAAQNRRSEDLAKLAELEAKYRASQEEAETRFASLVRQAKAEREALLDDLQTARDKLIEAEAALQAANFAATEKDRTWQAKLETDLAEAHKAWTALEATRLKDAEARLLAWFEQKLADQSNIPPAASAGKNAIAEPGSDQRVEALQQQVDASAVALVELRALYEGQAAASQAALRNAEAAWRVAEAERVEALQKQVDAGAVALVELRALYEGQAAASQAALRDAEAAWRVAEAESLEAADVKWQADFSAAAAAHAARCQALELELSQSRSAGTADKGADDAYVARLNRDIKTLRESLADREVALGIAHASLEKLRRGAVQDMLSERASLPKLSQRGQPAEEEPKSGHLVRDAIILMVVVMIAILCFPTIETFLPDDFRSQISSIFGDSESVRPPALPSKAKTPAPAAVRVLATTIRATNLRSAPLSSATILARLKAGLQVTVIEKQGHWEHVEVVAGQNRHQDGWVYDTNMRDVSEAGTKMDNIHERR